MSPWRTQSTRFGVFSLVGFGGAILQVALFMMLTNVLSPVAAMPFAVEVAILHNFLWHARVTWRDREVVGLRDQAMRLGRFHVANGLVSLVGNTILIYWLVQMCHVSPFWSAGIAIVVCAPLNFIAADRWVYSAPPRQNER